MKIKFEPRYLWIGAHFEIRTDHLDTENIERINRSPYVIYPSTLYIYICVIPTLPLCFEVPLYKAKALANNT